MPSSLYWMPSCGRRVHGLALVLALLLASCRGPSASPDILNTRKVKMPNGETILAEVVTTPEDMARGLMFRERLAGDRGMLFVHMTPGHYPYWMYQVKIPLDIIWLDEQKRVVEISEQTPPCAGPPEKCPSYGGNARAQFVLELAGGRGRQLGVREGAKLEF